MYQRTSCPGCGTPPSAWLDEDGYRIDPPPYVPATIHCYGCEAKAKEEKEFPKDEVGYFVRLVRNPES